jgi:Amidases related to nicotinamidase
MKLALLVIDLQKAYYGPGTKELYDSASSAINAAIPLFRKKGFPIVWIQHVDEGDGSVPGAAGFDFVESLKPGASDYRVHKRYNDAFNKTELESILKKEGVDAVLISGFCAEYCVISSCVGARNRDLSAIFLKGGLASGRPEAVRLVEDAYDSVSLGALEKLLG